MSAEKLLEGLGLSLADLGEFAGNVTDGTMMLAQLRPGLGFTCGRGVAVSTQELGKGGKTMLG